MILHAHDGHTDTMALKTVAITWCPAVEHDVAARIHENGFVDFDYAFLRGHQISQNETKSLYNGKQLIEKGSGNTTT